MFSCLELDAKNSDTKYAPFVSNSTSLNSGMQLQAMNKQPSIQPHILQQALQQFDPQQQVRFYTYHVHCSSTIFEIYNFCPTLL